MYICVLLSACALSWPSIMSFLIVSVVVVAVVTVVAVVCESSLDVHVTGIGEHRETKSNIRNILKLKAKSKNKIYGLSNRSTKRSDSRRQQI